MLMFSNLDIPLVAGFVAFVYSTILTSPDMLLAPWYKFVHETVLKDRLMFCFKQKCYWWAPQSIESHKNLAENYILKLLVDCDRCIAGQATLWWYSLRVYRREMAYNFIEHVFLICIAIFVTIIMMKIYRECRR